MEHFQKIMSNNSDGELMEILRNRDKYQDVAVNAAVAEAINRKLIENEAEIETKYQGTYTAPVRDTFLEDAADEARRKKANNDMIFGAMWCIGGIIATAASVGFIFWGAIVFGGIQFFRGLANSQ